MSDDRCFCGAEWVDEREECAAGHGFGEADRFRERAEKAEARVAELERVLGTLEHLGADGVSEDGCAWCLIGGMGDAYTVRMIEAEQHVAACPIGRALRRTGPSVSDAKEKQ